MKVPTSVKVNGDALSYALGGTVAFMNSEPVVTAAEGSTVMVCKE